MHVLASGRLWPIAVGLEGGFPQEPYQGVRPAAFGVLLDTVLVRSLLVPALAYDIGTADLVAGQAGPLRDGRGAATG